MQLIANQDAGAEAALHTMSDIFTDAHTDAVLLTDAENAFNFINCMVMLHNLKSICPNIAPYIIKCYTTPSKLFIVGGEEIPSSTGAIQGDPKAMGTYALGILNSCLGVSI